MGSQSLWGWSFSTASLPGKGRTQGPLTWREALSLPCFWSLSTKQESLRSPDQRLLSSPSSVFWPECNSQVHSLVPKTSYPLACTHHWGLIWHPFCTFWALMGEYFCYQWVTFPFVTIPVHTLTVFEDAVFLMSQSDFMQSWALLILLLEVSWGPAALRALPEAQSFGPTPSMLQRAMYLATLYYFFGVGMVFMFYPLLCAVWFLKAAQPIFAEWLAEGWKKFVL